MWNACTRFTIQWRIRGGGGSEGLTQTGGHSVECMHAVHYTVADPGGGGVRGFNTDRGVIVWNACTRFTIQWRIQGGGGQRV